MCVSMNSIYWTNENYNQNCSWICETIPICTRIEIQFNAQHSWYTHAPSRYIQVYFHRWLYFCQPCKTALNLCITGPVPLGSTNQNWWGVRLLPISISTHPVDCVHLCHLLRTQHHCLCPNGKEDPPSSCPHHPIPLLPTHPLIYDTCDIIGVVKNLKTSSNYCMAEFAMKQ